RSVHPLRGRSLDHAGRLRAHLFLPARERAESHLQPQALADRLLVARVLLPVRRDPPLPLLPDRRLGRDDRHRLLDDADHPRLDRAPELLRHHDRPMAGVRKEPAGQVPDRRLHHVPRRVLPGVTGGVARAPAADPLHGLRHFPFAPDGLRHVRRLGHRGQPVCVAADHGVGALELHARQLGILARHARDLGDGKWVRYDASDYTPLETLGRAVYIREGCWYCHSQYVRPVAGEELRWGPVSEAGEYAFDLPHLFSTRRIGPDLTRVGLKYADDWHYAHHWDPRLVVPESIMPSFTWLFEQARVPVRKGNAGLELERTPAVARYFTLRKDTPVRLFPNETGVVFVRPRPDGELPIDGAPVL